MAIPAMTSAMTLMSYQRVCTAAIGKSQLWTKTELEPGLGLWPPQKTKKWKDPMYTVNF